MLHQAIDGLSRTAKGRFTILGRPRDGERDHHPGKYRQDQDRSLPRRIRRAIEKVRRRHAAGLRIFRRTLLFVLILGWMVDRIDLQRESGGPLLPLRPVRDQRVPSANASHLGGKRTFNRFR